MQWFSGRALLAALCVVGAAVQIGWILYSTQVKPTRKAGNQQLVNSEAAIEQESSGVPLLDLAPSQSVDVLPTISVSPAGSESSNDSEVKLSENEVAELLQRVGVQIIQRDTEGIGSGVVVARDADGFDVLTACHVVQDRRDLTIVIWRSIGNTIHREEIRTVEVLDCDVARDLARLRVTTPIVPAAALSLEEEPADIGLLGEGSHAWGMAWPSNSEPQARPLQIAEKRTVARHADSGSATYWVVNSASDPGMSGGPLIDPHGRLVGVASGNSGDAGYYVHLSEIWEFMKNDQGGVRKGEQQGTD